MYYIIICAINSEYDSYSVYYIIICAINSEYSICVWSGKEINLTKLLTIPLSIMLGYFPAPFMVRTVTDLPQSALSRCLLAILLSL